MSESVKKSLFYCQLIVVLVLAGTAIFGYMITLGFQSEADRGRDIHIIRTVFHTVGSLVGLIPIGVGVYYFYRSLSVEDRVPQKFCFNLFISLIASPLSFVIFLGGEGIYKSLENLKSQSEITELRQRVENKEDSFCKLVNLDPNHTKTEMQSCFSQLKSMPTVTVADKNRKFNELSYFTDQEGKILQHFVEQEDRLKPNVPENEQVWFVQNYFEIILDNPNFLNREALERFTKSGESLNSFQIDAVRFFQDKILTRIANQLDDQIKILNTQPNEDKKWQALRSFFYSEGLLPFISDSGREQLISIYFKFLLQHPQFFYEESTRVIALLSDIDKKYSNNFVWQQSTRGRIRLFEIFQNKFLPPLEQLIHSVNWPLDKNRNEAWQKKTLEEILSRLKTARFNE